MHPPAPLWMACHALLTTASTSARLLGICPFFPPSLVSRSLHTFVSGLPVCSLIAAARCFPPSLLLEFLFVGVLFHFAVCFSHVALGHVLVCFAVPCYLCSMDDIVDVASFNLFLCCLCLSTKLLDFFYLPVEFQLFLCLGPFYLFPIALFF